MPEGNAGWLTAQRLHRALSGRPLVTSDFRVPQLGALDLSGQRAVETVSRGKHLLTRLDELTIHTHLAMEGSWHIYRLGSPWRSPSFQARLVLATDEWQVVGFRLAVVEAVERSAENTVVGQLGPDLLGPDWSLDEALARLTTTPAEPIAEALLDQRTLAGIGKPVQVGGVLPARRASDYGGESGRRTASARREGAPVAHRQPRSRPAGDHRHRPARTAGVGLPSQWPALSTLRHAHPVDRAGQRRSGTHHLLVPDLPASLSR